MRTIGLLAACLPCLGTAACVPSMARSNAKLEPGLNVAFAAGAQFVGEGETDEGMATEAEEVLHLEVDVEWAQEFDGGSGFAVQLKVPLNIVFMTLDLYYALPGQGETHLGFGAEIGALPGLYGAFTRYIDESVFVTFTPRALFAAGDADGGLLINPQLSVGMEGGADIVAFASFAHHTGRGFDFDIELFGGEDQKDYHKNFGLVGVAARF